MQYAVSIKFYGREDLDDNERETRILTQDRIVTNLYYICLHLFIYIPFL